MACNYFGKLSHVHTYSKFRPSPPPELLKAILDFLGEKITRNALNNEVAIDVGCGSGQGTLMLSPFFRNVVGLDPSADIIKEADSRNVKENVSYCVSGAETIPLENNSVALVTVGQAVHWFDKKKFYAECERILKPNGVLAVYGYKLPEPIKDDGNVVNLVTKYYNEVLGSYVLDGSRQVYLEEYTAPEFNNVPFAEGAKMIRKEGFIMKKNMQIPDVTGYISSWSAFQNYTKNCGEDAGKKLLKKFEDELRSILPNEDITVAYKYFLLLGRKS